MSYVYASIPSISGVMGGKESSRLENYSPELYKRPGSITWGHCSVADSQPRDKNS